MGAKGVRLARWAGEGVSAREVEGGGESAVEAVVPGTPYEEEVSTSLPAVFRIRSVLVST